MRLSPHNPHWTKATSGQEQDVAQSYRLPPGEALKYGSELELRQVHRGHAIDRDAGRERGLETKAPDDCDQERVVDPPSAEAVIEGVVADAILGDLDEEGARVLLPAASRVGSSAGSRPIAGAAGSVSPLCALTYSILTYSKASSRVSSTRLAARFVAISTPRF